MKQCCIRNVSHIFSFQKGISCYGKYAFGFLHSYNNTSVNTSI